MKKLFSSLFVAVFIGVVVALVYFCFSNAVEKLQEFIWFHLVDTEEHQLLAIPVAILGGMTLAFVLHRFNAKGHQDIGHAVAGYAAKASQLNVKWIVRALIIGLVSLVAGASLGPEAILLPVSYAVAYLLAKLFKIDKAEQFGVIGIIALLASFFNAYAAALIPLAFITYKKTTDVKKTVLMLTLGLVAVFASITTLHLLHEREGYIYLDPIGEVTLTPVLIIVAVAVSAVATLIPFILDKLVMPLKKLFDAVNRNWLVSGAVAGLGVGVIYFLLGPIGYFSGHTGLNELLKINSELTSLQLAGLAIGKLVVTAWSLATIYRGGVIFPQLLVGMSIALLLSGGIPDNSWLFTLLVSSFFGIFTGALGSLIIAAAFILSIFGTTAIPLIVSAAVGSYIVKRIFKKQFAAKAGL